MRDSEMAFLGMTRQTKVEYGQSVEDPIARMKNTEKDRATVRDQHFDDFEEEKKLIKKEIEVNRGPDIEYEMKDERRKWMIDMR